MWLAVDGQVWPAVLTHWHSSQMRKAPSVASSWLSWMSTLMTCTGWKVSCSREFRSERDAGVIQQLRTLTRLYMCPDVSSPSSTWSYTRSSQVMTRSNWSLQLWKRSGRVLMRLLRSNMCKMPFCVYLRRVSGQGRQHTSHCHVYKGLTQWNSRTGAICWTTCGITSACQCPTHQH